MRLLKSDSGYYHFSANGVQVILYLTDDLFPEDASLEKLQFISQTFPVKQRMIALPDLHFKVKNFVPSGMTIPLENGFSPLLLGPNNDGMGALRFSLTGAQLTEQQITAVFTALKKRVVMFRRRKDVVRRDVLENVFIRGIRDQITEWGFSRDDLLKFEDRGCAEEFSSAAEIQKVFPAQRPEQLPDFVPGHDLWERGGKCLGVLDGTSHFIELFKTEAIEDETAARALGCGLHHYYFLLHAGAGDICLISHRAYLDNERSFLSWNSERGQAAFKAFNATANFGFANRLFTYKILRETLEEQIPNLHEVELISDIPHDYIQRDSEGSFIHRKGATRLAPAGEFDPVHPFGQTGMPYLFPSSMGGDAYLIANREGNENAFFTVSHGAGRLMRKDSAIARFKERAVEQDLQHRILLFRYGVDQIEGQNPRAFKDMDRVMQLISRFNLAQPILKLRPLASLKA